MKKIFVLLTLLLISPTIMAEDWDDFSDINRMWDNQKSVTNQEFEEVMEKLEEKAEQKEVKKRKKLFKKISGGGTSLHGDLNPDKEIKELQSLKKDDTEGTLINIPVTISIGDIFLEKGYYKTIGEKDKKTGKVYLNFYQSQFFKAKLEVTETESDFNEETLDFAKIIPVNESFVKLIYGSLDFNAYVYLPYIK